MAENDGRSENSKWLPRVLAAFLAGAACVILLGSYLYFSGAKNGEAKTENPAAQAQVPADELIELKNQLGGFKNEALVFKNDIGNLNGQVAKLESDLAAEKSKTAALEGAIAKLDADLSDYKPCLDKLCHKKPTAKTAKKSAVKQTRVAAPKGGVETISLPCRDVPPGTEHRGNYMPGGPGCYGVDCKKQGR